jgi:hypothetical protein
MHAGISAISITSGFSHACALTSEGSVWCWGAGTYGQLGVGSTGDQANPVAVNLGAGGSIMIRGVEWLGNAPYDLDLMVGVGPSGSDPVHMYPEFICFLLQ